MGNAYDFDYLVDKILAAEFFQTPFKHIYIEDFFSDVHFQEIQGSEEISAPIASNDRELIDGLRAKGFKPISFPGCVTDIKQYVDWHESGKDTSYHSACEGFGMALRLYEFRTPILEALNAFLLSEKFNRAIAKKFDVVFEECIIDGGIQKYLDGYEISPHPDIRRKAATFMVNINPSNESENMNHHTHYLELDEAHRYVQAFWEGNKSIDRAWVPWTWARTVKQQTKNNSIVLFSPSNDTLHAVKADYDHLVTQRTQLYGNLWFNENPTTLSVEWETLDLLSSAVARKAETNNIQKMQDNILRRFVASMIPKPAKEALKRSLGYHHNNIGNRNI